MVDDGINTNNNNNNNNSPEREDHEINLYTVSLKYMVYWPQFVASVLACCTGMYVFLRYQTPAYNIASSVLIKEGEKKGVNATSGLAAMQDLGTPSMTSNFDNEVEILRSHTLIKGVANDTGPYIDMKGSSALGFNPPLYESPPVNVFITPGEADHLVTPVELRVCCTKEGQLTIRAEYKINKEGDGETVEQGFDRLPAILPTPVGVFSSTCMDPIPELEGGKIELVVHVRTSASTAETYGKELSVTPSSKATTIARVSLGNTVRRRDVDFINRLVPFYNQDANNEKNEVA